jgi:molybdopterin converting factor subunit 1
MLVGDYINLEMLVKEKKINVKFFSLLKEKLGESERTMLFAEGSTVNHIITELKRQHPKLTKLIDCSFIALNEEYTLPNTTLKDGDTMAIIPPVSGG